MAKRQPIQLGDHFSYGKLIRFALPSVTMLVFSSIYGVVDGIFISNFASEYAFSAVNLIMPIFMMIGALGFMMGAGGTAIVAKTLGEGKINLAKKFFSLFVYVTFTAGLIMAILGAILVEPISMALGADGELLKCCVEYGRIVILAMPFFMLQNLFQSFMIVAEKPKLGLTITVVAGCANMVLDALLVLLLPQEWKLEGAAIATSTSQIIGGTVPFIYFIRKNSSLLQLTKTKFYPKALLRATTNGSSELLTNVSASVVTMLYNMQLMEYEPEHGLAAYGAIMYVGFIFIAIFIGLAVGTAPIIGFHYGAGNKAELKSLLRKGTVINFVLGLLMTVLGFFLSGPLAFVFAHGNQELFELTVHGFKVFSFSFFFSGLCIFASSFFTALNNGLVSAAISFMRTIMFQMVLILTLPLLFKTEGIWYSMLIAEILSLVVAAIFLLSNRKKYEYF